MNDMFSYSICLIFVMPTLNSMFFVRKNFFLRGLTLIRRSGSNEFSTMERFMGMVSEIPPVRIMSPRKVPSEVAFIWNFNWEEFFGSTVRRILSRVICVVVSPSSEKLIFSGTFCRFFISMESSKMLPCLIVLSILSLDIS